MLLGVAESVVLFVACAIGSQYSDAFAATPYIFSLGTLVFTVVVATVSVRVGLEMHWQHWSFQLLTFASAVCWLPAAYVFGLLDADGMEGGMEYVFGSPANWLIVLLCIAACALPAHAMRAYKHIFKPQLRHVVREIEHMKPWDAKLAADRLDAFLLEAAEPTAIRAQRTTSYGTATGAVELPPLAPPATPERTVFATPRTPLRAAAAAAAAAGTAVSPPLLSRSRSAQDVLSPQLGLHAQQYSGFDFSIDDAASAFIARKYTTFGGQRSAAVRRSESTRK